MDSFSNKVTNKRLNTGDIAFFEYLYKEYYPKSVFYAAQYLRDKEEAKEVAQETFITLWEKQKEIEPGKSIQALILTITKNKCLNLLRKKIAEKKYADSLAAQEDMANYMALNDSTSDIIHMQEIEMLLQKSLSELPTKMQDVYKMSRDQEMTYDEIAVELGVSVKTIEYRMSKVLVHFRKKLRDYLPIFILGRIISLLFYNNA